MNRTTATCIAGIRSKTTSRTRIHFFPRTRGAEPFTRFTRRFLAFGLGILAKRLRWRPERNPVVMTCWLRITHHVQDPVQKQGRPYSNQRIEKRSFYVRRLKPGVANSSRRSEMRGAEIGEEATLEAGLQRKAKEFVKKAGEVYAKA